MFPVCSNDAIQKEAELYMVGYLNKDKKLMQTSINNLATMLSKKEVLDLILDIEFWLEYQHKFKGE